MIDYQISCCFCRIMFYFHTMALKFIRIHNTEAGFIEAGETEYLQRIRRFIPVEVLTISAQKKWSKLPTEQLKLEEGKKLLSSIQSNDFVVLLDEKGKQYTSLQFAEFVENKMAFGGGNLVFIVGGAFGFSQEVYARANAKLSLSKLTTSHQLVRLFFLEQLYRAFTIMHNHPYHNE